MTTSDSKFVLENGECEALLEHSPSFDAQDLLERLGGNAEALEEIVALFLENTPRSLKALYEAASNEDWQAFWMTIHDLKGVAGNVSAKRLYSIFEAAYDQHKSGRNPSVAQCLALLRTIQVEFDSFRSQAEGLLHQPATEVSGEVLVVDDEEDLRNFLSEVLRDQGFTVRTAASGHDARIECERQLPDVVISDIRMRNGTGVELLEWLSKLGKAMPVVICMSAFTDLSTARAFELGAHAVFTKPFEVVDIVSAVRRFQSLRIAAVARDPRATHPTTLGHLARTLALGELTTSLATELAVPLETISTRAEAALELLNSGQNDPNLKKTLESIVRSSQRSVRVLQSLGSLAQYAGGETVEPLSIKRLLQETMELVARRVITAGLKIEMSGCDREEQILCRPSQTILILATLLRSAIDSFSAQKAGLITISAQPETFMVNISVSDNGSAVAERGRLLELGSPLAPREKNQAGLHLARLLAEDERGSLVFDCSQGVARFTLRLPRAG